MGDESVIKQRAKSLDGVDVVSFPEGSSKKDKQLPITPPQEIELKNANELAAAEVYADCKSFRAGPSGSSWNKGSAAEAKLRTILSPGGETPKHPL